MDQSLFQNDRARLFSIAYRMLGSASDAEDVLQDAWIRVSHADQGNIRSPQAFVTTVVTRLCLDRLKSAQRTREEYVGPWLPEPVLTSELPTPETVVERAESVTLAFLVLLERLSPEERAVFLLKDVFDYDHAAIAEMLGVTIENSRQLLHRAKSHLAEGRSQLTGIDRDRRAVAERFAAAFAAGDPAQLAQMLTSDVGMWSDGGGQASAARRPLLGKETVLNFLLGLHRTAQMAGVLPDVSQEIRDVNSEAALVVRVRGRLESIFVLSLQDDAISGIRVIRNPEKLVRIDRQLAADLSA